MVLSFSRSGVESGMNHHPWTRPATFRHAIVERSSPARSGRSAVLCTATRATRFDEEPLLLRVADAARLLSLSRSKVYKLMADGTLPSITIGRSRRILPEDLQRYVVDCAAAQH